MSNSNININTTENSKNPVKTIYETALLRIIFNRIIVNFLHALIYIFLGVASLKILGLTNYFFNNKFLFFGIASITILVIIFISLHNRPNKKQVLASIDYHFNTRGALSILIDSNIELDQNVFVYLLNKCSNVSKKSILKKYPFHFNNWHLIGAAACLNIILIIAIPSNNNQSLHLSSTNNQVEENKQLQQTKSADEIMSMIESADTTEFQSNDLEPDLNSLQNDKTNNPDPLNLADNKTETQIANESKTSDLDTSISAGEKKNSGESSGSGTDETNSTANTKIEVVTSNIEDKIQIDLNSKTTNGSGDQSKEKMNQQDRIEMKTTQLSFNLSRFKTEENWNKVKPKYKRIIELYFNKGDNE